MIREVESHWQETAELGIEAGLCLRTGTLTTALRDTTEGRGLKTPPPPLWSSTLGEGRTLEGSSQRAGGPGQRSDQRSGRGKCLCQQRRLWL